MTTSTIKPRPVGPDRRTIWLASASPRRRELLTQLGLRPIVRVADVVEAHQPGESPADYTLRLAADKGRAVRQTLPGPAEEGAAGGPDWIVSADTVVVLDELVLEKPVDAADAERLLGLLSGRTHVVTTAFWLGSLGGTVEEAVAVNSRVTFRDLSPDTIARYVATGEPMDKAGAYGIQGLGGAFVASIEGSYFNIVGLPIAELVAAMEAVGALIDFPFTQQGAP